MPKMSKDKGGEHERAVCRKLSAWLSRGERADLFTRNVLSGGAYTARGTGTPGDVMAAHPLSYEFLQVFHVEAKHWRDLQVDAILWRYRGELLRVIEKLDKHASAAGRIYLLVARQNYKPDLVFLPYRVGADLCDPDQYHHALWRSTVYATRFDDLVLNDPDAFVRRARTHLGGYAPAGR